MDRLCTGNRTYLWTFTLKAAVDYEECREAWTRLLRQLTRYMPEWSGIRVYEVHPGQWNVLSHGLHIHVVSNKRHDVNRVRELAESAGWGRIHVVHRKQSMGYYLAKYLAKPRPPCLKGWRLWATFRMKERTRLSDILIDSLRGSLFRLGFRCGAFEGMNWGEKCMLIEQWEWQFIAGEPLHRPFLRARFRPPMRPGQGFRGAGFHRKRAYRQRLVTPQLPWAFMPRPLELSAPAAFSSTYSVTALGDDITLRDLHTERHLRRFVEGQKTEQNRKETIV